MNAALARDFLPIRVYGDHRPFGVDFCHFGRERLTRPFFEDSAQERLWRPFNQLFRPQRTLEELVELARTHPGIPPKGFIFHMSRCGSTLVAQQLAALPDSVVLSEAPPLDAVLQLPLRDPSVTEEEQVRWLRAIVSALGQPRTGRETRLFVKVDSWHALFLPLLRRAFPDVPWIFLYREPVEVLVSQARARGGQMVPGVLPPALLGLSLEQLRALSLDEYAAQVLARICRAALTHQDARARFVPYDALPGAIEGAIAEHFGLRFTSEERSLLAATARFNAKSPSLPFSPDGEAKQREANAALRDLADRWLAGAHAELEALSARWRRG